MTNRKTDGFKIKKYLTLSLVLLPGFQKGGISMLLKEKGTEQFWPKKCNLRRTRKNLKNGENFTTFRVNKMFSHKF
jgi:hypothetical protein